MKLFRQTEDGHLIYSATWVLRKLGLHETLWILDTKWQMHYHPFRKQIKKRLGYGR